MSYRELRNFSIYLQSLGYPSYVSTSKFRTPNFPLVAQILKWLLQRLDPSAELSLDFEIKEDRVEFLQQSHQIAWSFGINLNLRKLYKADGYAVKELLKISKLLFESVLLTKKDCSRPDFSLHSDLDLLRNSRNLGSQLVQTGAKVHEKLGEEIQNRSARNVAVKFLDELAYNLESNEPQRKIEQSIVNQIDNAAQDIERFSRQIKTLQRDEKNLTKNLSRKQSELERTKKQLDNLKTMELPFMAEQKILEQELQQVYITYIETYRSLSWLDGEMQKYREKELLKKAEADRQLKRMQKRLREEQRMQDRGAADDLDHLFQEGVSEESSSGSAGSDLINEEDTRRQKSKRRRKRANRPSSRRDVFTKFEGSDSEESNTETQTDSQETGSQSDGMQSADSNSGQVNGEFQSSEKLSEFDSDSGF